MNFAHTMLIFSKKSPCRGANMAILGAHWQAQAGDAVARGRLRSWLTQVFFKAHAVNPRAHVAAPPKPPMPRHKLTGTSWKRLAASSASFENMQHTVYVVARCSVTSRSNSFSLSFGLVFSQLYCFQMPLYSLGARRARFATPAAQFFSQPLSRKPRAQPHAPPCTMRAAMVAPRLAKRA